MAVFSYSATDPRREDSVDEGIIVARDIVLAKQKLESFGFESVKLKRVLGLAAIVGWFRANYR